MGETNTFIERDFTTFEVRRNQLYSNPIYDQTNISGGSFLERIHT